MIVTMTKETIAKERERDERVISDINNNSREPTAIDGDEMHSNNSESGVRVQDPVGGNSIETALTAEESADVDNRDEHDEESEGSLSRTEQSLSWRQRFLLARKVKSVKNLSAELKLELEYSSELLLDLLFEHLSKDSQTKGLSLPASAVGWIALKLYEQTEGIESHERNRLSLLRFLLPRATHVRITADEWPPSPESSRKQRQRRWQWRNVRKLRGAPLNLENEPSNIFEFLDYYIGLKHHPHIDMRIFPKCKVLLLDRVPAEWLSNLIVIRESLEVLRVERTCIYDLQGFLLPPNLQIQASNAEVGWSVSSRDPLAPPEELTQDSLFPRLTHMKLSQCSITDSIGQGGKKPQSGAAIHPALAYLTELRSLCLSHNQLSSERALGGLVKMPYLTKVDLSYNCIGSLRKAHYRLGNIQTLILSHNQLESAEGIDRLFSLQTLWLDYNKIDDLSKVSALARLPELESLRMHGNPVEVRNPRKYRVELLDLFREKRKSYLPDDATYRDLQSILPILDDRKATMEELKALKSRTFVTPGMRTNVSEEELVVDISIESGISERSVPGSAIVPVRIPKRKTKSRQAEVDVPTKHVALNPMGEMAERPIVEFSLGDVLLSLCEPETQVEGNHVHLLDPKSVKKHQALASDKGFVDDDIGDDEEQMSCESETLRVDKRVIDEVDWGVDCYRAIRMTDLDDKKSPALPLRHDEESGIIREGQAEESQKETALANETELAGYAIGEPSATDIASLKLSDSQRDDTDELKKSTTTTEATADTNIGLDLEGEKPVEDSNNVDDGKSTNHDPNSTSTEEAPTNHPLTVRVSGVFPEALSHDDLNSVQSSMGSPSRDGSTAFRKYQLAEENSTYDGPEAYRRLKVYKDLELYFRVFVFLPSQTEEDILSRSTSADGHEEGDWRYVFKWYPRIQLWPSDRKFQEIADNYRSSAHGRPEEFRRLWKERVVACGKSALRRLTPNRGARYGFHGELLWSDSSSSHLKPDTVAEYREVIACCSNSSLYFISDHDKVTLRCATGSKRKFPLAISKEAEFQHAVWPHAMVRHPLSTLRGITIGFGFQRLTLRFGEAAVQSPDDYTYVLLTSNKADTISLLKDFQDMVQDCQESSNMFSAPEVSNLLIENDDRHVLDALGVAVAPDVVGVVLHYQILGQRWKHGDRGVVRRVCVVTDTKLFLLDEDYVGDGSESVEAGTRQLGETVYRLVDSASLTQITEIHAADADPLAITICIRPLSSFQKTRNWRLVCRDRLGAERLVDDVRRAKSLA